MTGPRVSAQALPEVTFRRREDTAKHLLTVAVTALVLVPSPGLGQSIIGVWKRTEVVISAGPDAGRHTVDVQPGLVIFTNKHYAMMSVSGFKPRPRLSDKPTDEELARAFEPFTANAGTYEVKGSTLTYTALVAKNPGTMDGKARTMEIRLDGDSLWFITKSSEGIETRYRYVLVERFSGT